MSWLSKAFGLSRSQNPANAAQPYLQQIPGVGHQYYDPYIQQGQQAGQTLQGEYGKQLDPSSFMDHIMGQYKQSEGYKGRQGDLMKQMAAVAGQGGYAGTPMAQQQYGEQANKLMADDQQQYLQNALGIYNQGIGGEREVAERGYGASGSLADMLGGALGSQATNAFGGQQQMNQNRQAMMSAFMKMLGQGASAGAGYMGGGWTGAANALTGGGSDRSGNNGY